MRRILLLLPLSAIVIAGLIAFKVTRRYESPTAADYEKPQPAPRFLLANEHSQIVRIERYLGRQKILIVFFDGARGPDHSPIIASLSQRISDIKRTGAAVLAIDAERPSQNRYGVNLERRQTAAADSSAELKFPFTILSDILEYDVHKRYGAYDAEQEQPLEAVFVIDRAGLIQYSHIGPEQLGAIDDWLRELRDVR